MGRFSSTTLSKSKVMICLAGDGFQLFIYQYNIIIPRLVARFGRSSVFFHHGV